MARTFAIGWCGGSGIAYGMRLVQVLLAQGCQVHLSWTRAALRVLVHEGGHAVDLERPELLALFDPVLRPRLFVHRPEAVEAAPSSGSAGIEAVALVPCSMGTLARVAHGFSSNLVERMADVALKEGRRLVVVPRETPLSALHLENMLKLARLGATVLPAMPGFYHRPATVADMVDFVVAKVLDRLQVEHELVRRWRTPESSGGTWNEGEE